MARIQSFFQRHPALHNWTHRLAALAGGILVFKNELLSAVGYVPGTSSWPKVLGYVLAVSAFSKILLGEADRKLDEAAPEKPVPASEAITAVEKENAKPKEK